MTYQLETFIKNSDGTRKAVSMSITDDLEWAIETEVKMHGLGVLLAQTKGKSGTLAFEHGMIKYKEL
jgi:hypothetical protein